MEEISLKTEIPKGKTPSAKKAEKKYLKQYTDRISKVQDIALTVLVWGPSPQSNTAVSLKRQEIKNKLIENGFNAMFSEEIELAEDSVSLAEKTKEAIQAKLADIIIVFPEGAPGALAEAHDFSNYPSLASKFFILFPKEYKDGYSSKGAIKLIDEGYGGVFWYDEGDIPKCTVLGHAIRRCEARRQIAFNAKLLHLK